MTDQQGQPSGADLDAVAAEQQTTQNTSSDAGDQISKAVEVEPTADNPAAVIDPTGAVPASYRTVEEKYYPAQPPIDSSGTQTATGYPGYTAPAGGTLPADPQFDQGARLSKLEADFAALVKLLDEEYSIRPVTKEMAEARAQAQAEQEVK